jgi:acyl transferase domain-containing protein
MCIAGGLDTFNDIFMYMCFSKTPALSPSGNSRPFDRDADGTILGEGLGALVLKRLEDAERDGDQIYAVIKGIGTSSDGRGNAIYAPSAAGQTKALRDSYAEAGVTPDTIELLEAHGTGTKVGDAVELQALSELYREHDADGTWCALGSVKSMIGHTKSAAGVAGLIKAAMALKHQVLPPTIKVEQPAEQVEPGSAPMYVNTTKRPWVTNPDHPRRAAISAFGFGGSNFHCVLEEPGEPVEEIAWDGNVLLFGFSADSKAALKTRLGDLDTERDWAELRSAAAQTLLDYDGAQPHRLVIALERDQIGLQDIIANGLKMLAVSDDDFWISPLGACYASGDTEGSTAALFPGQGAQYVGMLRDLACQFPQMTGTLSAANAEAAVHGARTSDKVYPIPVFTDEDRASQQAELTLTENAQPAIGAVSLGAFRVLEHFGFDPEFTAGHSYGELVALCAADRIDQACFHQLSRLRGELMGKGEGDRGGMLSIAADIDVVRELLKSDALDLVIANHNTPSQVIVSGASDQLAAAAKACSRLNLKHRKLEVSAAFHSEFVADAAAPFADALEAAEFAPGTKTVMANVIGDCYPDDPEAARELLASQITSQVHYVDQVEKLYELGVRTFVDVGPRTHAAGMVRQILGDRNARVLTLDSPSGERGQFHLACLLGALGVLDSGIDLNRWDAGYLDSIEPVAKGRLTIAIDGANYRSPHETRPARSPAPKPQTTTMTHKQQEPVVPAPATSAPAQGAAPNTALEATQQSILALQKMQEQTANLHRQYLEGQETAQLAIARLLEQQQRLLSGQPVAAPVAQPVVQIALPVEPVVETPVSVIDELATLSQAPEANPEIAETAAQQAHGDIHNVLLEVVSAKTGYPMEMLSLDMSLDTDLGIDSIKRVEILSALQERLPWAPTVSPEELGTFRFLQHIVEFLAERSDEAPVAPSIASEDPPEYKLSTPSVVEASALSSTLLEVVADKTGYPVEMLNLEMNMETDLGIDSIKRVEILSALQECLPDMPAVKPEDLGRLQTLQQVVDHVSAAEGVSEPVTVATETTTTREARGLERRLVTTVPLEESGREALEINPGASIWVAGVDNELSQAICAGFKARGFDAQLVGMDARGETLGGLVVVAPPQADARFLQQAFELIQSASSALQGTDNDTFLAGVTSLGGSFGLDSGEIECDPIAGGLAGLIKTADKEWPGVACKALDISQSADMAETVVDECLLRGPLEVGLSESGRVQVETRLAGIESQEDGPDALQAGDVVIVSGGARGVTAEVAVKLAETLAVNLLLLGRSPLPEPEDSALEGLSGEAEIKQALLQLAGGSATPAEIQAAFDKTMANREVRANLARIKQAGVIAKYCSIDVRNSQAVKDAIAIARERLGPIRGIVHGAGVLADRLIEDKTLDQFKNVYSTKVDGLQALLAATEADPLRLMVMFSSSTARFGRKGQCDYAVANEVLNKVAQHEARKRPDCRVLSINWGPWDGGMVTPALSKVFAAEGVGVIPLEEGADYLMREIAGTGPVELVVLGATESVDPQPKASADELQLAFEKSLSIDAMPVLADHVMDGKAVLPMAIITEWLAHAAMHNNPGMVFSGFNDLKIFKGVTLENGEVLKLQVLAGATLRKGNQDMVTVELRNGSILHARAEMVLAYELDSAGAPKLESAVGDYAADVKTIYSSGKLFHGAELQGIEKVLACSASGIVADVNAAPGPAQWMKKPLRSKWLTDPLALDVSYQLMILWSFDQLGAGSLPTGVHRYRQYQSSFPKDGTRIVIGVSEHSTHRAKATIEFLDRQGALVARIEGYECVVDQSLAGAFGRNKLTSKA